MQSKCACLIRVFSINLWIIFCRFIIWKNKKEVIYSGQNNSDKAQLLQGMKSFMAKLMLPENDYILVGKTLLALITI